MLNMLFCRSCLSLRMTRFCSILMLLPLVDTTLNILNLSSSLLASHCIHRGDIIEVLRTLDVFLFSKASFLFIDSGSTVSQPLIRDITESVCLLSMADFLTTSKLFSKSNDMIYRLTWFVQGSQIIGDGELIVAVAQVALA